MRGIAKSLFAPLTDRWGVVVSAGRYDRIAMRSALSIAALCCLATACGGGSSSTSPVEQPAASPAPNARPAVAAIDEQTLEVGSSIQVQVTITDADADDSHALQASSSDPAVATVLVAGATVTVTGIAGGTATITVTATDNSGSANAISAEVTFAVTVDEVGWVAGVFEDAPQFKNLCAVPRQGVDARGNGFPDRQGTTLDENNWLRSWSNDTYLWYDEIVDRDPACCDTADYFGLLKTFATTPSGAPRDRFHFTEDTAARLARVSAGVSAGYGADFAILAARPPRLIRVAYTEPDSPARSADVALKRGTTIVEIDGAAVEDGSAAVLNAGLFPSSVGETHEFKVRDTGSDEIRTVTMESASVTSVPVRDVTVIDTDTGPVGYFVFNTFIAPAERGLMDAVEELAQAGVRDLVIDLRYNGGGSLAIANQLGYMVAGSDSVGQVFAELEFNDKHTAFDPITGQRLVPDLFRATATGWFTEQRGTEFPALNLERVFVLSGPATCSASEVVINGLRGIDVDVVLIGDTTCGKPYGFYPHDNCGTTYYTIHFRSINAAGFGDYADGFTPANSALAAGDETTIPGCAVADDFDHPFGDPEEGRLSAALQYRRDGSCPAPLLASADSPAHGAASRVVDATDPLPPTFGELTVPPGYLE